MTVKRIRTYSIRTYFTNGPAIYSLGFYFPPKSRTNVDNTKLSDAKMTLKHCRTIYPNFRHEIIKRITIIETLKY